MVIMTKYNIDKGSERLASHEFGIMESNPISGKRYDDYEPEKYNCISIDDDYIEGIEGQLCAFDSFCHTVDIPMKGLNYCGVTLIPSTSIKVFLSVVDGKSEYAVLRELLIDAENRDKFVIHYGL